ncbi:Gfo/Idh/MocA family protein [Lentibacillus sp. CBA3610]|uniref:Gfo/Idh/MocA family protein n=1 Tax=Lentibacillus sp. CBA3610 TaxID=2518176 RepID=UPI0015950DD3|nr:Gfo/Idh/MocA family oxidoreductase [Lentibacillus sp. CBA3610]QKY70242.1 Gfo/Idh/MocA family oxidoreductase [Lentibacillus sp. CBA3610]
MLNLCTIGTSQITRSFIEAAEMVDDVHVAGVYSRDSSKAKELAEAYNIANTYTDMDAMLADKRLNTVYIASPNVLHFEQVMACLKKQKHVICEKPIFTNITEFHAAYEEADRQGVYLFEAMRNLHTPNFWQLKNALELIGKVRSVYFQRMRYSSKYDRFLEGDLPNVFSRQMGGGALRDLGVYPLSLTVALFGEPELSYYHALQLNSGVDGSGTMLLDFAGFKGTIMCSKISTSYNASEIHGERGTLIIDDVAPIKKITFIRNQGKEPIDLFLDEELPNMSYQIQNFKSIIECGCRETYTYYRNISEQVVSIIDRHGN